VIGRVAAGALAGAAAGMVAGIAARMAMRSVALGLVDASMQVPIFTVAGTLAILVSGAIVGAPLGAAFVLASDRLLPGPRGIRGLLYGTILLFAFGPLFFIGTDEFFSAGRVLAFVWLFPIFGIGVDLLVPVADRVARPLPAAAHAALALAAIGGAGLVLFGIVGIAAQSVDVHGPSSLGLFASWSALAVAALIRRRARSSAITL
jgi:hypothetical protein